MLANASGGRASEVAKFSAASGSLQWSWSPDGQWLTGFSQTGAMRNLVKIKASPGSSPVTLTEVPPTGLLYETAEWSPSGSGIMYASLEGMSMVSPEGGAPRKVASRQLLPFHFSKDGRQVFGIFHNLAGSGAEWQLYSIDVATGAEKLIGPVDLPGSVQSMAGFSIHPAGKRALISVAKWPFDIWMLEGFDQLQSNWLARLFRR